jgi:hypothetical protein
MRKWIAFAGLFALALVPRAFSQIPMGGITGGGSSTAVYTLVQDPDNTSCGTGTTCAITLTQSIAAGDLLVFTGYVLDAGAGLISTDNSGTFVPCLSCSAFSNQQLQVGGWVIAAGTEATTITLTFATSTGGGKMQMYEFSYTGGTPQFDGANQNFTTNNTTTPVATTFTPSNNAGELGISFCRAGSTCSSLTSPFTKTHAGSGYGWAHTLNQTSAWSGPTWTISATNYSNLMQMEFGSNVTPCANQTFIDYGGTSGSAVTVASLQGDMHGWTGPYPVLSGTTADLTYQTLASMPLRNSTGRLCDGGNYTDSSTTGLEYSTANNATTIAFGSNSNAIISPAVSQGAWYASNLPSSDSSVVDMFVIEGVTNGDYLNAHEFNGTGRDVEIECGAGTSSGNVELNRFAITSVANASGGSTVYTGTITGGGSNAFAGWQVAMIGFAQSANNGTFTISASSTTTLTVNNASGVSDTTGTAGLWYWIDELYKYSGNHTLKVYSSQSTMTQVGSTLTCPAGGVYPAAFFIGDTASGTLTSGHVYYWGRHKISLDGLDPLLP